jgi:hypothetical protein
MLRHKWEAATATILNVQSEPGTTPVHHYQVEVRKQNGEVTTSRVSEQSQIMRAVGEKLNVEMHSQTGELRIHGSRADALRGVVNMAQAMRDMGTAGTGGAAGGLAAGVAGLAGMLAGQQGNNPVNVMGPGGQNVPMNLDPNEMRSLTHALIAGSPAEKQAARQRLQEIKSQAQQQAANPQGGYGAQQQQGGFGQQQQQGGYGAQQQQSGSGQQQAQGGFGQQQAQGGFSGAGPSSFDDIGTPRNAAGPGAGSAGALNQQGGFSSAQSSFGSFNMGSGQGSREERLAKLQQQFNKGILTESEYEAQRQQVINGG